MRRGENFKKRWRALVRTLDKLHYDYGADFRFSMSRKRQDYVLRPRRGISPLSPDDIGICYPPQVLIIVAEEVESTRKRQAEAGWGACSEAALSA